MDAQKKLVDYLIIGLFIIAILSAITLMVYSIYAVIQDNNINAATSIVLSCVCFALSIATAKQFQI